MNVILDDTPGKSSGPAPKQKYYKAPTSEHGHVPLTTTSNFPNAVLKDLKAQFGDPTYTTVDTVVWNKNTLRRQGFGYLDRIMLASEGIHSNEPETHLDHVYIRAKTTAPDVWNMLKLSDAITYDRGGQILTARCAGWRTCGALMLLAIRAGNGKLDYREARERQVVSKVLNKAAGSDKYFKQLESELTQKQ